MDDARLALEAHVRTTRWLRRGLAARLPITHEAHSGAFEVSLESFTESRGIGPAHEPFHGQDVDGPERGTPPGPWQMRVDLPGLFLDWTASFEVPHTAAVRTCHTCNGSGRVTCGSCLGKGRVTCSNCGGRGHTESTRHVTETDAQGNTSTRTETERSTCWSCSGSGRVTCSTCRGDGRVTCGTCHGHRQLKHFQQLRVQWEYHVLQRVIEKTDLPDPLISGAAGRTLLQEEEAAIAERAGGQGGPYRGDVRVCQDVHDAANELIRSHCFPQEVKLHRQRLTVRGIPVVELHYGWGKETRRLWVFGFDRRVHAPDYPLSIVRIALAIAALVLAVGVPLAIFLASRSGQVP